MTANIKNNIDTLPVYKGAPLLGVTPEFQRDPILFLEHGWQQYGDHFIAKLGPRSMHIISNPQMAQEILTTHKHVLRRSNRFEGGTPLTYILGLSLITTD